MRASGDHLGTMPDTSPAGRPMRLLTPPRGIVFDLDGTLVDTVGARIRSWVEALAKADYPVSPGAIAPLIGMDGKELARRVASAAGRPIDDAAAELIDRASGAAFDRLNRSPRPLPGARAALVELSGRGVAWAIATSSRPEQVQASLASLDLDRAPLLIDGRQVAHAKPEPDLLLLAASRLAVAPAGCWYVGDSTWDMRAATAARMPGIGVTAGAAVEAEALRQAGASRVLATLAELAGLLSEPPST
jgi:HAD superfamily hydrolase (TIGR01509 family)